MAVLLFLGGTPVPFTGSGYYLQELFQPVKIEVRASTWLVAHASYHLMLFAYVVTLVGGVLHQIHWYFPSYQKQTDFRWLILPATKVTTFLLIASGLYSLPLNFWGWLMQMIRDYLRS